jgi:hypothetical protein
MSDVIRVLEDGHDGMLILLLPIHKRGSTCYNSRTHNLADTPDVDRFLRTSCSKTVIRGTSCPHLVAAIRDESLLVGLYHRT